MTVSHLRFGPQPIRSTYLIDAADFVACHQFGLLEKMKVVESAKAGATMLLNSPWQAETVWDHLPAEVQRELIDKHITLHVIDADRVARDTGMGNRVNTVMQPCFFALSGVLPRDEAIVRIKDAIAHTYAKRGADVVRKNFDAVDDTLQLKAVPDTYAIGEMLDWEAPTGGYLLQACFSTAVFAARAILTKIAA